MSINCDYSMSSINSINENIYNAQKQEKSSKYRLRKIFKPLLKMLLQRKKKISKHQCTCKNSTNDSYDYSSEISDNDSNETLETKIIDEIKECNDNSAIYIYGDERDYLMQVNRQQTYVPVHFARTQSGTFFWTTLNNQNNCQENLPHLNYNRFDRWIQA